MRLLGVRSGWVFFQHADSGVAVDLKTGDVTDVFSITENEPYEELPESTQGIERAEILARSAFATSLDPDLIFSVPQAVRASAQRGLELHRIYQRGTLVASATGRSPDLVAVPADVRAVAATVDSIDSGAASATVFTALTGEEQHVPLRTVERMHLFFSRHDKRSTPPEIWAAYGGDAGTDWSARVLANRTSDSPTVADKLANEETIDYDTLKLLPRAFSVIPSPHTASCAGTGRCTCGGSRDSGSYPSERAVTFAALGGEVGQRWAEELVRHHELKALAAAAYNPDANVVSDDTEADPNVFDASQPHVYSPVPTYPEACLYCLKGELDPIHDDEAVNYELADIDPADAHYFVSSVKDEQTCAVCEKAVDDTLHKQAALASYYANKADWDKRLAETNAYWEDQGGTPDQPVEGQPAEPLSAAATFGVDWIEDPEPDPEMLDEFERSLAVDQELDDLAWQRRPDDPYDDMCYYGAFSGDDALTIDQVYVSDNGLLFRYDPYGRHWVQTDVDSTDQIFELDDESAHAAIRALSMHPDVPVDLREVNPGEAFLMEQAMPALDPEIGTREVVVTAAADRFADGYTPQERSVNAKKQVRDANGRFAKGGSRVATAKGAGTITKVDPATQKVEVAYDGGQSEWIDAHQVSVVPGGTQQPTYHVPTSPLDGPRYKPGQLERIIKRIPGKPRAVAGKARLPRLLQPIDLQAILDDFAGFVERDRRKARGMRAAGEPAAPATPQQPPAPAPNQAPTEAPAAAPSAGGDISGPESSDVKPIYLAVVDEADQQSVLDLLALTPASTTSTQPVMWRRTAKGWERDDDMLRKMRSSAPPPVVKLEDADVPDVMAQVDSFYADPANAEPTAENPGPGVQPVAASLFGPYGELFPIEKFSDSLVESVGLIAAGIPGIADTPSDEQNVRRLERYWTIGEGGLKIRWMTPGDMTRCMRYLAKYMPRKDMHAGYCAKLHHKMTGTWPGDHRNVGMAGSGLFDAKVLSSEQVIAYSALVAAAEVSLDGNPIPTTPEEVPTEITGAPFLIPIVAPVGVKSGDGRMFAPLALSTRDLPLPLMWQVQTQEGHDASVIVGRIDSIERAQDGSLINARGVFDVGPYGREAERLVRHKFLRGVSVDLDNFEAEARPAMPEKDEDESAEMGVVKIRPDEMTITNGRMMGATLVAKPAFQEVSIELDEGEPQEEIEMADGTYVGTPDSPEETEAMVAAALTAAGIPLHPPVEWFDDPQLKGPTPLTIQDDGRVFGHIATWDVEHIGLPFSTRPPKSRSNYAYFHTGVLRTQEGVDVPVGQITLAGGHADLNADAAMAVKHYDDTASAMCDVHAGEDRWGIYVAGALRPNVSGDQVRAFRAAAPSGDWRPINGRLEMVAVCQVNVPGFPTVRARVASGHVMSLVAAGTATLNRLRSKAEVNSTLDQLLERIETLEAPQREALEKAREAAVARFDVVRQERAAAAAARFHELQSSPAMFRDYSSEKRDEMAKDGRAMPDGSYPIDNVGDLKNAIRAVGRAKPGDRPKVRRHIRKHAKKLSKPELIPDSWSSASILAEDTAEALTTQMLFGNITAAGGLYPNGEPWDPTNHPRDERGRFRDVIARLKDDLAGETGTGEAIAQLDVAADAERRGDVNAAQSAATNVLDLIDKIENNTVDAGASKTLREGYTDLAEAIANLPLNQGDENKKFRFSDLPEDLKNLIQDLVKRASDRLDGDNLDEATGKLKEFMSGGDVMSQPNISAELSKVLRFLI